MNFADRAFPAREDASKPSPSRPFFDEGMKTKAPPDQGGATEGGPDEEEDRL